MSFRWVLLWALVSCFSLQASPLVLQGSLQQGGLVLGEIAPGSVAFYQGKPLQTTPSGQFLLGLGREAPESIELTVVDAKSMQTIHKFAISQRQYSIQRVNGVPSKTVTPSDVDLARIRSDSALVRQARKDRTSEMDFLAGFQKPLIGPITGVYGSQRVCQKIPITALTMRHPQALRWLLLRQVSYVWLIRIYSILVAQ
jgi:hypothetical protein